ncbi:MAG TPA: heme lyase CcmF/NrfE family subunit [Baekduia sp.]|nr:heme lyase CcmF/NrfE family subunit [Baekduia sp.]
MADVGHLLLIVALGVCVVGIYAALTAAHTGQDRWLTYARRAVFALFAVLSLSFLILELAFLRTDLSYEVVSTHSSTTTPVLYRIAAAWSSQEGSLLLWAWLLSLWSSLVMYVVRGRLRDIQPYAIAVLLGFGAFFTGLLVFSVSPFTLLATPAAEGAGLNPLLRHPSMMIHPPMLYSGYTLFAIPFAFAVSALLKRHVGPEWIAATRRFALAAWLFLGIGIMLGARWSYAELGWGGYWAWDPVENASLLPWLTGTAFIHSIMLQERRGMLKIWNASLVLTTGTLCILGTFLVRSGILDSIHAFGASTLGVPFVTLIAIMIGGSIALVVSRREVLRSENRLDSLLSREAVFIGNNLVLVGLAFVVFWGTFFPLISEAVTGTKRAVGPPWFDKYTVPLALILVLLSGIGPVIAWRRATLANLRRNFTVPAIAGAIGLLIGLALGASGNVFAVIMFGAGAFVAGTVGQEFWRGVRARRVMSPGSSVPRALVELVARNRRRYGGYTVHLGVAVLFVGVAASSAFQQNNTIQLAPGQTKTVGDYVLKYDASTNGAPSNKAGELERIELGAKVSVWRDGKLVTRMRTSRGYYPTTAPDAGPVGRFFEGESVTEVGLDAGPLKDYWVAYAPDGGFLGKVVDALDTRLLATNATAEQTGVSVGNLARAMSQREATFRFIASPLVGWIWVGAIIVFAGGLIALWPAGSRTPAAARAASGRRADLEEEKSARYREIREAELDYRTGKLAEEDYNAYDAELRANAVALLDELDELEDDESDATTRDSGEPR